MKTFAIISLLAFAFVFTCTARPSFAAGRTQDQNCDRIAQAPPISDFLSSPLAETPALKSETNLWLCLTAYADCDPSLLTPSDAVEVRQNGRWRNLLTCESSVGDCDTSKLTPAQAVEVAKIQKDQNLANCETGDGICDVSMLTAAQSAEVRKLQREQNLLACETGDALCNNDSLSRAESRQVSVIEHQRNLLACQTGEDYCNTSMLTPAQARQITAATKASFGPRQPCAPNRNSIRTANQGKPGPTKS